MDEAVAGWASAGLVPILARKHRANPRKIEGLCRANLQKDDTAAANLRAEVLWRFVRESTGRKAGQFVLRLSVGIVTIGKQRRTKEQYYGADRKIWSFISFSKSPSVCNKFPLGWLFRQRQRGRSSLKHEYEHGGLLL